MNQSYSSVLGASVPTQANVLNQETASNRVSITQLIDSSLDSAFNSVGANSLLVAGQSTLSDVDAKKIKCDSIEFTGSGGGVVYDKIEASGVTAESVATPLVTAPDVLTVTPVTKTTTSKPVEITNTTASTNTSSGALLVNGGVGILGQMSSGQVKAETAFLSDSMTVPQIVATNALDLAPTTKTTTTKPVEITNATASSSKTTGAVIVTGGMGVGGKINSDSLEASTVTAPTKVVTSMIESANDIYMSSTSVTVAGSLTAASLSCSTVNTNTVASGTTNGNLTLAGNGTGTVTTSFPLRITNTTQSDSNTTGALTVSGGLGVNGVIRCSWMEGNRGRHTNVDCVTIQGPSTAASYGTDGDLTINTASARKLRITGGNVAVENTTNATSKTTGALVVTGGVGVGGDLHVGNIFGDSNGLILRGNNGTAQSWSNFPWFQQGPYYAPVVRIATIGTINYMIPETDNNMNLGGSSNRWFQIYAINGTVQTSGETLKDVLGSVSGLEQLMKVRTLHYTWKSDAKLASGEKRQHYGLSAENLLEVFPHMVHGDKPEEYGVNYSEMIPVLVKAVQELKAEVDALKKQQPAGASLAQLMPPPKKSRKRKNDEQ